MQTEDKASAWGVRLNGRAHDAVSESSAREWCVRWAYYSEDIAEVTCGGKVVARLGATYDGAHTWTKVETDAD